MTAWLDGVRRTFTLHPATVTTRAQSATPPAAAPLITAALLYRLGVRDAAGWAAVLAPACAAHGIDRPLRVAAFLANTLHETAGFSVLVESLNYSASGLRATWPSRFTPDLADRLGRTATHPADQAGIAEVVYGSRMGNVAGSGDGFRFRGCGLLQTTGRANHERLADLLDCTAEDVPARLVTREGAALSACLFWQDVGATVPADRGDIRAVRLLVNGGLVGFEDVQARYAEAKAALGVKG